MGQQIDSRLGTRTVEGGKTLIQTRPGDSGWVLFGPYVELPPGRYAVSFRLRTVVPFGSRYETIGSVDVCSGTGAQVHVTRNLTQNELTAQNNTITLPFETQETAVFEFRVFANGATGLVVEADWVLIARDQDLLAPKTGVAGQTYGGFMLRHLSQFAMLVANGASVVRDGEGAIVTLQGVRLDVRHPDDFQVITEVFLHRDCAFAAPRDACVIDVGMNVGLASLFFASQPGVREVHAFEPFAVPYQRAVRNFGLNPAYAAMIQPHNLGLGRDNAAHTVLYNDEGTIGASVLGLAEGTPADIAIRDAPAVLRPIVDAAKARGRMIVVKLDCEGSEFPIFETLAASGLLGEPDVYLIEWHKWWEGGTTQARLVTPLLERGYVVLDQTRDSNPHAGQIYAVKTRR